MRVVAAGLLVRLSTAAALPTVAGEVAKLRILHEQEWAQLKEARTDTTRRPVLLPHLPLQPMSVAPTPQGLKRMRVHLRASQGVTQLLPLPLPPRCCCPRLEVSWILPQWLLLCLPSKCEPIRPPPPYPLRQHNSTSHCSTPPYEPHHPLCALHDGCGAGARLLAVLSRC